MPTPQTGTALSLSHFYSTRFYFYPLLLTNHLNRNRNFNFNTGADTNQPFRGGGLR